MLLLSESESVIPKCPMMDGKRFFILKSGITYIWLVAYFLNKEEASYQQEYNLYSTKSHTENA